MQLLHLNDLSYAGFIVKPHGFKGEVILGLESLSPDEFPEVDFIFLKLDGLPVPFKLKDTTLKGGNLIVRLEDVDSEETAKKLNGTEVYLEPFEMESVDVPGFEDLKGFEAIDETEGSLGVIVLVEELPMQLIAHCDFHGKELLFPLNESLVRSIDMNTKRVYVQLPEGLADIYREG
jgi:16S rRNA processing protein RimM